MTPKKHKRKSVLVAAALIVPVILAVCIQGGNNVGPTPVPTGTAVSDTPNMEVSGFGRDLPSKIIAGYQLAMEADLKNSAPLLSGREGELSLKNVKAEFYNFGPYIAGCDDYAQSIGSLKPQETSDVKCTINVRMADEWPDRTKTSFDQTLKLKVSYSYDLLASLDDFKVLSKAEYARQNPAQAAKSVSIRGPLGMSLSVESHPVQEEKLFPVRVKLQATKSANQDIALTETAPAYNVQYVQLQVPFAVAALGNFDRQEPCAGQTCLIKENVRLGSDGTATLDAYLQAPKLGSPEETYSVKALATGFTIFKIADLKITGYAS